MIPAEKVLRSWIRSLPIDARNVNNFNADGVLTRGRNKKSPSELLPRVHHVVSLLKRWLLGTHHGAVRREHLGYYLDEFTFRFNRRRSRARGLLFYRLLQQSVQVDPVRYGDVIRGRRSLNHNI